MKKKSIISAKLFRRGMLLFLAAVFFSSPVVNAQTWSSATACSGSPTQVTVTSTMILGTTGSYLNSTSTRDKVFDGNVNTFFDGPAGDNQWVGLDLGSAQNITCIKFRPRSNGDYTRINGGKFQTSATADFSSPSTIYTLSGITSFVDYYITSTGQSTRYVRYLSPTNGFGNIAEVTVYTGPSGTTSTPAPNIFSGNVNVNNFKLVGKAGSNTGLMVNEAGHVLVDSTIYARSFRGPYNNVVPDYVFENDYDLKPLSEVENYIRQYKHLPDVPSNEEYKKRGEIDLLELNLLLLKKIEELTLYQIDLEKEIKKSKKSKSAARKSN